jgi:putative hemolysin
MVVVEIIVVVMLFVLNGFFAMRELAIVSSRRVRLERLSQEGHEGAIAALALRGTVLDHLRTYRTIF